MLVDNLYLRTLLDCAHEQKAQGGAVGMSHQKMQFCDARGSY